MPSLVPDAVAVEESYEERLLYWIKITGELVMLAYLLDVASNGAIRTRCEYEWDKLKARWKREKEISLDAKRAIFEAMLILDKESSE